MESYVSYDTLIKPSWAPAPWLFAPVWMILYVLIAISFGAVFYSAAVGDIPLFVVLPFILNLVFNFSFTYFQFKLKNNYLAAIDIILVLATLVWAMFTVHSYIGWVAPINVPYFLWVAFATDLQLTITWLNR